MFELSPEARRRIQNLHLSDNVFSNNEQQKIDTVAVEIFEIFKKRELSHFQAKRALEVTKAILDEDLV